MPNHESKKSSLKKTSESGSGENADESLFRLHESVTSTSTFTETGDELKKFKLILSRSTNSPNRAQPIWNHGSNHDLGQSIVL